MMKEKIQKKAKEIKKKITGKEKKVKETKCRSF